jgi:phage tail sheath protein FI
LSYIGNAANGLDDAIDAGIDKFTVPVFGGFDGLDIQEKDPFGTHVLLAAATETNSYAYYTVNRALDSVAEKEDADINILTAPGIINENLTDRIIDIAEKRQDCLAIIDVLGGYTPKSDSTSAEKDRIGSVDDTIADLRTRSINSSYACSYYPWVKIRDRVDGSVAWVPPSVVALGVMGRSEATSELWFAPAGFSRGGLSAGASGLDVVSARQRLRARERDRLYENNINPIATFPAEGLVVFGQKTLQATPSALDRINVRRLMIYIKRQISAMASDVLFDQNVQATWQRFLRRAEPFLTQVKIRFGLSDFMVVLDETTTTPDLVDRNIMYAKVFVKPARAIEFIALDFVITNTGADFLS